MAIEIDVTLTVAEVAATDDYRVELKTRRRRTDLCITDARTLAAELLAAATEAEDALGEDFSIPTVRHGFDVDMERDVTEEASYWRES